MITNTRMGPALFLSIQVALVAMGIHFGLRLFEANAALTDNHQAQVRCAKLSREILQMRDLAEVASESGGNAAEEPLDTARFEQLAGECGIGPEKVRSINPLTPQTLENTEYERKDWVLDLQDVTMSQLLSMALRLELSHTAAKVTSLRLSAVSAANSRVSRSVDRQVRERWNAELTLTQLKYVARSNIR